MDEAQAQSVVLTAPDGGCEIDTQPQRGTGGRGSIVGIPDDGRAVERQCEMLGKELFGVQGQLVSIVQVVRV
ncbi:hypothetical protein ACFVRD_45865 [Streptomyces sp. NPDC057908]|uniref:hypothetical protein n=1 Tax=Streptomyces sp. NPDC057908 TaxID=3346276 RepID=UPI0036EF50B3